MQIQTEEKTLVAFIDESGNIAKGRLKQPDFFIIAMVFTNEERQLNKVFKRERMKVLTDEQKILLAERKEIKGSDMTEAAKTQMYQAIIEKCAPDFEIGIIVLDNQKASERLRKVSSRTFNYILEKYFHRFHRHYSRFTGFDEIFLHIDERNVSTNNKDTLEEFLNTTINIDEPICQNEIKVSYHDSRAYLMLQLADMISNTFYRYFMRPNEETMLSVETLLPMLCNHSPYFFPEKPLGYPSEPLTSLSQKNTMKLTI